MRKGPAPNPPIDAMPSPKHRFSRFAVAFSAALAASFPSAGAQPPAEARIGGDRVNVRAAADGESQVLGQLDYDARVVLAGSAGDPWVKLELPESFDVWIYSPLVKTDPEGRSVVGVNRAQLRAGPGLHHASVGIADRGVPLDVRGHSGDWTRLSPKGVPVYGYVTNLYVKLPPPPGPAKPAPPPAPRAAPAPAPAPASLPAAAVPAPVPAPAVPVPPPFRGPEPAAATVSEPAAPDVPAGQPVAAPPELAEDVAVAVPAGRPGAGRDVASASPSAKPRHTLLSSERPTPVGPAGIPSTRLRSDVPQAGSGSYAGTLARAPAFGPHPTRWRLVRFAQGSSEPQTVCYVYGNDAQLSGLSGRRLTVSGAVYRFRSTALPTIYAQDIVLDR